MSADTGELNPNLQFSEEMVAGLAEAGLKAVCIAPGSRSTPLALAFEAHPCIDTFVHLDERCAGFFALGMAQASGRPVALVCTSGTAALEFHAAVVEAKMAGVPMLVLTADRPPELRHSGANQTIDQVKMYGDQVLWAVEAALPEGNAPDVALRNIRTLAARAYAAANGIRKGPVHVNLPFRKPLEPRIPYGPRYDRGQSSLIQRGVLVATSEQIKEIAEEVCACERGWIVCGPWAGRPPRSLVDAIAKLSRSTGYPVFADPLSGLRFGPHTGSSPIIGSYESFLQHRTGFEAPEVVIRFGAVPTSKYLNEYLEGIAPPFQLHVRSSGVWGDDSHRVNSFLQVDEALFCIEVAERCRRGLGDWGASVLAADERCQQRQEQFLRANWFDVSAVAAAVKALPDDSSLFVGNSLPVRHLDQFSRPDRKRIHVYGNRGASGIDGIVSSALGAAAADRARPSLLIIGDVSFYHDMNGLMAIRRHGLENVTVLLLNNGGGGVFRRLPIAEDSARFEKLFLTPTGLDFSRAASLYGLAYRCIHEQERITLDEALCASIHDGGPTVIEVRTDGARDEQLRRKLIQSLNDSQEDHS
ncbi:MAG: 2-succinyl-5-enolpyruvyl-6-hydroxy-3-cyclohexene-1-carboxylic-acid synthase [Caldilineaceae bacterium]|nr:2-succinyl-5-enolpyruvyl-6-hydroxy-3-cyclohexene-1-carboxylic-acid synthase [Caldilineaceae bacterium]